MSASDRKVSSNRRNAKKSTGPRTHAGRQRSSLNATRHSLTARPARQLVRAWYKIILDDAMAEPDPFDVNLRCQAALSLAEAEAWLTAIVEADRQHVLNAHLEAADRLGDPPWPRRVLRSVLSTIRRLDEAEFIVLMAGQYELINRSAMDLIQELRTRLRAPGSVSAEAVEMDREGVLQTLLQLLDSHIERTYAEPQQAPPIQRYLREADNRRTRCLKQWIGVQG